MAIRNIALSSLIINKSNDRHGELENETAAISWLFSSQEKHMRNLAKDIVKQGEIYEMPLVAPRGSKYIVFDGNRRVTCLKLLESPHRAPTTELQDFFRELRKQWTGKFPLEIQCQVESNPDRIDEILFRRHTGTQNGIGRSKWDDRMQANFIARTGKGSGVNVAEEVERRLADANLLPKHKKIPRSTMNRLLSAEPFRNRLGFSTNKKRFDFTHDEAKSLDALARVADDLAHRRIVLGDIWDVEGKRSYLDELEREGVLPSAQHALSNPSKAAKTSVPLRVKTKAPLRPAKQTTLIPQKDFGLVWPGRLQRHHKIWEELQFQLDLHRHPNAISVLFCVLLELAVENCLEQSKIKIQEGDRLAVRMLKIAKQFEAEGKLSKKQIGIIKKFQHEDKLVSADTLNRYVHSPNFAPSPDHLMSLWDSLSEFIVVCLTA